MKSWQRRLLFGLVMWVVVFAVAFLLFPVRESSRPLFESIMPVVLAAATALLGLRYFRHVSGDHAREGLLLGLVWLAVNVGIDLPLMLAPSPMQMSLGAYVGDIGLTYLIIPIITTAIGIARGRSGAAVSSRDAT